jgi:hypothetical protein
MLASQFRYRVEQRNFPALTAEKIDLAEEKQRKLSRAASNTGTAILLRPDQLEDVLFTARPERPR